MLAVLGAVAGAQPVTKVEKDVFLSGGAACVVENVSYVDAVVESVRGRIVSGTVVTALVARSRGVEVQFKGGVGEGVVEIATKVVARTGARMDTFLVTYRVYGVALFGKRDGRVAYLGKGDVVVDTDANGVGVVGVELSGGDRAGFDDLAIGGVGWSRACGLVRKAAQFTDDCAAGFDPQYKTLAFRVAPRVGGGTTSVTVEWDGVAKNGGVSIASMTVKVPHSA